LPGEAFPQAAQILDDLGSEKVDAFDGSIAE